MDDMNKSGTMSESEKMPILVIDQHFSLVGEQVYMCAMYFFVVLVFQLVFRYISSVKIDAFI